MIEDFSLAQMGAPLDVPSSGLLVTDTHINNNKVHFELLNFL